MSKIIKGKLIQDEIPTPEKPVEIKSLNLFEVNGIQYTDNIPDNLNIGITKEQYCEYLQLQQENQQLKAENYRLEHNEKVLLQREESAINYIDQVIMYKPCAREIDEELNVLICILRGGNNER